MPKITIPVLPMHPAQQAIDASPARYKVINCGRRFGKPVAFFALTRRLVDSQVDSLKAI